MTKVLLLKPYRPDTLWVATPPIGLMNVAAWLRRDFEQAGEEVEIRIRDLNPPRLLPAQILDEVVAFAPDVIGISALSVEADATRALSHALRSRLPDVPIVLGGPYPSHDPGIALRDRNLTCIVINEGEETFAELVRVLRLGGDLSTVHGIAYRDGDDTHTTPERPFIEDLDTLPMPAYDLIDVPAYFHTPRHSRLVAHPEYMTVVSTRGCPYRCAYCHVTMGKKTRYRSADKVVEELELLATRYGIREIAWSDDIWNLDRRRSKRICDLMIERGLKLRMCFPNGVRGDLFDDELLDKLVAAGAYMITWAPESGSPRVQKYIEKHAKLDKIQEMITKAAARGLWCHAFFMVGFPTETEAEMRMTFDFALRSKLCSASFFIVNAHPGTKLYEMAKELGKNVGFKTAAGNYFNPEFQLSEVPTDRVASMLRWTMLRFYLDPRRALRILRSMPRKRQLVHFVWDFLHKISAHFRRKNRDVYPAEGLPDLESVPELQPVTPYNRM